MLPGEAMVWFTEHGSRYMIHSSHILSARPVCVRSVREYGNDSLRARIRNPMQIHGIVSRSVNQVDHFLKEGCLGFA